MPFWMIAVIVAVVIVTVYTAYGGYKSWLDEKRLDDEAKARKGGTPAERLGA